MLAHVRLQHLATTRARGGLRHARPGRAVIRRAAFAAVLLASAASARAALLADAASAVGDSITRAFDANTDLCTYTDQPARSFASGDDHGASFCEAGNSGTFSHAERLECAKGGNIAIANDAESGAKIDDFQEQASMIRARFATLPGPRYVTVLLGHNDACTNVTSKTGNTCGGNRDPDNYCRTTAAAFEHEFRRGLDELIQIPDVRVAVLALIRISQLCNFRDKNGCGPLFGLECGVLWQTGGILDDVFGKGGICLSLTSDCSDQRRIDMYETLVAYNEILERVTNEYAALPVGGASPTGAVRAAGVALRYLDTPFYYRLQGADLSCCDCFHPSDVGHRKLAEFTWNGLACSEETPCCALSDDPLTSARCGGADTASVYPGGFWADGVVCGNGIVDPGETCDDGNMTGGDGCSDTCAIESDPTPTATELPIATPSPTGTAEAGCAGDCDDGGAVTVDEVVTAVNIALGLESVTRCPAADLDAGGTVTIAELLAAVNRLLSGCAPVASLGSGPPGAPLARAGRDSGGAVRSQSLQCDADRFVPLGSVASGMTLAPFRHRSLRSWPSFSVLPRS